MLDTSCDVSTLLLEINGTKKSSCPRVPGASEAAYRRKCLLDELARKREQLKATLDQIKVLKLDFQTGFLELSYFPKCCLILDLK